MPAQKGKNKCELCGEEYDSSDIFASENRCGYCSTAEDRRPTMPDDRNLILAHKAQDALAAVLLRAQTAEKALTESQNEVKKLKQEIKDILAREKEEFEGMNSAGF